MECDPNGVYQHAPGAKLDAGKLRAGLVLGDFSRALRAVCAVGTFGAGKYTDHGWLSVANGISRYADARARHWLDRMGGEDRAPDSGLLHLAHEAWNLLAELELTLREQKNLDAIYERVDTLRKDENVEVSPSDSDCVQRSFNFLGSRTIREQEAMSKRDQRT